MNATDIKVQKLDFTLRELDAMLRPNVKNKMVVFMTSDNKQVLIQGRVVPFDIRKVKIK